MAPVEFQIGTVTGEAPSVQKERLLTPRELTVFQSLLAYQTAGNKSYAF